MVYVPLTIEEITKNNYSTPEVQEDEVTSADALPGDGTLRFYRLAIPVTESAYDEDLESSTEVRSPTNNSNDKKVKLDVLDRMMELFKGTIYRQTMFAEFEKITHEMVEKEEILTNENLEELYYDLNKKYFGKDVYIDNEIRNEWSRIPHFYYNFYVYKYATGLSAACYIVDGILNGKENALSNYKKFLSLGGSMDPLDELKVAGVDMNDPSVIESAIKMFDETIELFKEIYNK
jgi:oligoendopeptidase F